MSNTRLFNTMQASHEPCCVRRAWGAPHFGQRSIKNAPASKLFFVPQHLTNYSTGTHTYLYHPKEGAPKGANRLCTILFHEIRRVKYGSHDARFARKLILVADNAADNKNMDVIAFTCELVARDWFDIVEFYFGEVGHTHNGEDSTHHVLNEHVGRHVALTLGEHVLNYAKVWTTKESTPEAVVAHDQYDWKTRYGSNDVVHRLGGFTKTKLDPESVHAWHVRRSRTGPVEVLWKKRATDKEWLGEHGTVAMKSDGVGSPGFLCLKKVPTAPLSLAPWNPELVKPKYLSELKGASMEQLLRDTYKQPQARKWIVDTAAAGRVVPHTVLQAASPSTWGQQVLVGAGDKLGTMYLLELIHDSPTFWNVPAELLARQVVAAAGAHVAQCRNDLVPMVGYARVPTLRRPTAILRKQQEAELRDAEARALQLEAAQSQGHADNPQQGVMKDESSVQVSETPEVGVHIDRADAADEEHPLGRLCGDADEENYVPREGSFVKDAFYLVRFDEESDPMWGIVRVHGKPQLRRDQSSAAQGVWMVVAMWYAKTKNSTRRFMPEKRKKKEAADAQGRDWCYCASFDGQLRVKGSGGGVVELHDESVEVIEATVKQWYRDADKDVPASILGKPEHKPKPARNRTKRKQSSDSSESNDDAADNDSDDDLSSD